MFKTKYRIVLHGSSMFSVEQRPWWFPFYVECGIMNTYIDLERALQYLEQYKRNGDSYVVYEE